mmetsp:Transcript_9770/g.8608  ORF Transcript_9770/g.8608 Transcript_9770/m.8608 type:complete len:114 (-) Transcript_9770:103-444(-)
MRDLEKNSLTFNEEDNYFCGKKLSVKWVHKYQIYDKIINILELPMTHTSRGSFSSVSSVEGMSEFRSFSSISSIEDVTVKSASSEDISITSSQSRCSHPSIPKIKSRLKIVFT